MTRVGDENRVLKCFTPPTPTHERAQEHHVCQRRGALSALFDRDQKRSTMCVGCGRTPLFDRCL